MYFIRVFAFRSAVHYLISADISTMTVEQAHHVVWLVSSHMEAHCAFLDKKFVIQPLGLGRSSCIVSSLVLRLKEWRILVTPPSTCHEREWFRFWRASIRSGFRACEWVLGEAARC